MPNYFIKKWTVLIILFIAGGSMFSNDFTKITIKNLKQIEESITFPGSSENDSRIDKNIYKYDRSEKLIEVEFNQYKNSKLIGTCKDIYLYDNNGRLTEKKRFDSAGHWKQSDKIKYNSEDRKTEVLSCDSEGQEFRRISYTYDKKGNLIVLYNDPFEGDQRITEYFYDNKGQLGADETSSVQCGSVKSKSTYKYNDKGQLIEQTTSSTKNVYEYDNRGNLSKVKYFLVDVNDQKKESNTRIMEYAYLFY